ncbi:MAG: serine protease [Oligoflexia bacterium]|nr:serine protease [Oligoflexia bacterium]
MRFVAKAVHVLLACSVLFAFTAASASTLRPSVIYGDDDRLDWYQVDDVAVRALADSTVSLIDSYKIKIDPATGLARLSTTQFGKANGLCKDEPFYDQPTAAFCSGSLVAPDIIMTAGHCIETDSSCKGTRFVFGFAVSREGELPQNVLADDVYECASIIGRKKEGSGPDWALIRLTRPVTNHQPLAVNRTQVIANGTPLIVIGHPAGLPSKVAGGATVRDNSRRGYFVANLDTYGGNSGSAVFNAQTGLVEGILVRGETDFNYDPKKKCSLSNICESDSCRGEDVTKVSEVLGLLEFAR